jgi:hypothetical protein
MDADKLRKILENEYGIKSDVEFIVAVKKFAGINIGIFTAPIERGKNGGKITAYSK